MNSWRDREARAAGIANGALVRARREARLVKHRIGFNTSAYVVWKLPENANGATASTFLSTMRVLEQSESMHKNAVDAREHEEREESAEQDRQEAQR